MVNYSFIAKNTVILYNCVFQRVKPRVERRGEQVTIDEIILNGLEFEDASSLKKGVFEPWFTHASAEERDRFFVYMEQTLSRIRSNEMSPGNLVLVPFADYVLEFEVVKGAVRYNQLHRAPKVVQSSSTISHVIPWSPELWDLCLSQHRLAYQGEPGKFMRVEKVDFGEGMFPVVHHYRSASQPLTFNAKYRLILMDIDDQGSQ
ncbi:hypothetical protein KY328_01500 [Candidatus Woesearchaeota archaeon]|nr:hypothetical protein [Candidatus Woesearchaeota archaeon]